MATIRFTANLARHRAVPALEVEGGTVREVLKAAFRADEMLRGYVLDEQGRLRKHVNVFVDGAMVADRLRLSDVVAPDSDIYVLQALSGG